jgi:hypothetical protein
MSKTLQFRRYPANVIASLVGANGEIIIDTTNKVITIHDGLTAGGSAMASANQVANLANGIVVSTANLANGSYSATLDANGTFNLPGTLVFPDHTIQTTAFTGQGGGNVFINESGIVDYGTVDQPVSNTIYTAVPTGPYASDAIAASHGVSINGFYYNADGVIHIRLS